MAYEDGMKRLAEIVTALEAGALSLADSVALYEEGVGLAADCKKILDEAQLKVVQESGEELTHE